MSDPAPTPYTADELADDVPRTYDHRRLLATVDAERARADQAEAERDELHIAIHGGCCCPAPYDQCTHDEPLLQVVNRYNQVAAERDALAAELRNLASETAKVLLIVKPNLDRAYPDDPRWTPWTRWVERHLDPLLSRALDASPTEGNPVTAAAPTPDLTPLFDALDAHDRAQARLGAGAGAAFKVLAAVRALRDGGTR